METMVTVAKAINAKTAIVGNSGTTAVTVSTVSVWLIRLDVPPVAGLSESSVSKNKPVGPVAVTLNVTVAMVPLPLNAGAVPVDVASR